MLQSFFGRKPNPTYRDPDIETLRAKLTEQAKSIEIAQQTIDALRERNKELIETIAELLKEKENLIRRLYIAGEDEKEHKRLIADLDERLKKRDAFIAEQAKSIEIPDDLNTIPAKKPRQRKPKSEVTQ